MLAWSSTNLFLGGDKLVLTIDQLGKETLKIAWQFILMVRLMALDQDSILTL